MRIRVDVCYVDKEVWKDAIVKENEDLIERIISKRIKR